MCGKQGLCTELLRIGHIFNDSPGNGQPVKCAGPSADLIENQQTVRCGVPEDIGNLCHFHHKGALSAGQIIRGSHPGKNPVHNADIRRFGGNKGTDLRHQDYQRCLTHISRFSGHIRAGDNGHPLVLLVQIGVVGDEHVILHHLLDNRVTSLFNVNPPLAVQLWPDIPVMLRHIGQRAENVQRRDRLCGFLDSRDIFCYSVTHLAEQLILQTVKMFLRSQDGLFNLLQPVRGVPLRTCQCLSSCVVVRNLILKRIGHLDAVAEDLVVLDPQGADPCFLALLLLQIGQPLFSVLPRGAVLIHHLVVAVPDDPALLHRQRRILLDGIFHQLKQILQRIHILSDILQKSSLKIREQLPDKRKHLEGCLKRHQISGIGGLVGNPAGQSFQVIDRLQVLPDFIPVHRCLRKFLHGCQPVLDGCRLDQGLLDHTAQHSGSHGRFCPVKDAQKGTLFLLFPQGFHQLQVSAARTVNQHVPVGKIRRQRGHLVHVVFLRLVQILEQRTGGDHAAGKIRNSQPGQGRSMKVFRENPAARFIVEIIIIQCGYGDMLPSPYVVHIQAGYQKSLVADDFGRPEFLNFIHQTGNSVCLGHQTLSGRDIRDRQTVTVRQIHNAHQVIVPGLIQLFLADDGSGGHYSDHFAPDNSFCLLRILHLFTDGDLMPLFNQPGNVGIRGVIGNPAHRRALLHPAVLSCQCQLQFLRDRFRVIKKHLVKVAQSVKKNTVFILLLCCKVVLHHR